MKSTNDDLNGELPKFVATYFKKIAGVNPTEYGVWQQNNEGEDKKISNDEYAELDGLALEIFFTAKAESTEGM